MTQQQELATFGAGCFWCVEAIFQDMRGVEKVVSGYMGGAVANPSYEAVCTGTTGHAEVIQVTFDPSVVSYETLLEVFWRTHDPTTLNRKGQITKRVPLPGRVLPQRRTAANGRSLPHQNGSDEAFGRTRLSDRNHGRN